MNPRVRTIWAKELTDFVRDWRTLLAIILVPLLAMPLLLWILPMVIEGEIEEREEINVVVEIQTETNQTAPRGLLNQFENQHITIGTSTISENISSNISDPGEDRMRIRGGDVDAILRIQLVNADNEDVWRYSIIHDSRRESSIEAWNRVDGLVNAWSLTMTTARLEGVGLDVNATLEPVRRASGSELTDVADVGERSGRIFSLFVPFFVTLWTATLAIQPSIDMTAGERERQTLEALLATPATRKELLVGKWLAVSTIAAAGVITQFAGLGIAIAVLTRGTTMFTAPSLSLTSMALLFVALLTFSVLIVAVELAIAMKAKSVREAGALLTPITVLMIAPVAIAQFLNLDSIATLWHVAPIVNLLIAMRELLLDRVHVTHVTLWLSSSLFHAGIAVWYAARQFGREDLVESIS